MLGSATGLSIRTITILVDSISKAVSCAGVDRRISVVAVSWLETAELLVGVGPGAEAEVLVLHIPIAIQVVIVVALTIGVYSIVRCVRRTWVHAGIVVVAVHFIGPGVAVLIDSVVEPHVARIEPILCARGGREPDR